MVDDFADDQKRGIGQRFHFGRQPHLGAVDDALLLSETPFGNHGDGCVGLPELNEVLGDVADASAAHEDHEGGRGVQCSQQVGGQPAILSCGGAEPRRGGHAAKGEGDAHKSREGRATRNARDVGPAEAELFCELKLFAGTSEDHGVAAFEPHDPKALLGATLNPIVDEDLRRAGLACTLADTDQRRIGMREVEDVAVDQAVVEHELGLCQNLGPFQRQQVGIAGSGANQPQVGLGGSHGSAHDAFAVEV